MVDSIKHSFVSAKANSVDSTLVSSNAWNDGHTLSGGLNGQVIIYDNTQENNARYTDGPKIQAGSSSSGATGSPYTASLVDVVLNTPAAGILMPNLYCITSGGAAYSMQITLNAVLWLAIGGIGSGIQFTYPHAITLPGGTTNVTMTLIANAGTFLSIQVNAYVLTMGI